MYVFQHLTSDELRMKALIGKASTQIYSVDRSHFLHSFYWLTISRRLFYLDIQSRDAGDHYVRGNLILPE